jgi:diguanylate cyclase (GGDEF)-like protein
MNAKEFIDKVHSYALELEEMEKSGTFESNVSLRGALGMLPKDVADSLVQERRTAERRLRAAQRDVATERRRSRRDILDPRISNKLAYEERARNHKGVFVSLDLNHFKTINDQHGHPEGDRALKGAMAAMHQAVVDSKIAKHPSDIIHRIGGDEFGFLVETPEQAAKLAYMVRHHLDALPLFGDGTKKISASIGLGLTHDHADTAALIAKHKRTGDVSTEQTSVHSLIPNKEGEVVSNQVDPKFSDESARRRPSGFDTSTPIPKIAEPERVGAMRVTSSIPKISAKL